MVNGEQLGCHIFDNYLNFRNYALLRIKQGIFKQFVMMVSVQQMHNQLATRLVIVVAHIQVLQMDGQKQKSRFLWTLRAVPPVQRISFLVRLPVGALRTVAMVKMFC